MSLWTSLKPTTLKSYLRPVGRPFLTSVRPSSLLPSLTQSRDRTTVPQSKTSISFRLGWSKGVEDRHPVFLLYSQLLLNFEKPDSSGFLVPVDDFLCSIFSKPAPTQPLGSQVKPGQLKLYRQSVGLPSPRPSPRLQTQIKSCLQRHHSSSQGTVSPCRFRFSVPLWFSFVRIFSLYTYKVLYKL